MAESDLKVKVTEKGRGKLVTLSKLREGFVKSFDGTKIAYRSYGKSRGNDPVIVCCNGLGVGTFFWTYLEKHFRTSYQVVTWDYRGHGKSDLKKDKKNYSLDAIVRDGKAVLDHLGVKKALFVGHSLGVQVSLEFYRRWPKIFSGMALCFGTYARPLDTFYNIGWSKHLFQIIYAFANIFPSQSNRVSQLLLDNPLSFWMGGILKMQHTGMIKKEDSEKYIKHILNVDPVFFTSLLKSAQEHSAEDLLKKIKIPTLILTGELDQFTPMWLSKKMNRLIPDSELFIIKNATHAGLVEQPDLINLRIEKFIRERLKKRRRVASLAA